MLSLILTGCGPVKDSIHNMEESAKNIHFPSEHFHWGKQSLPLGSGMKVVESKLLPFDSISIDGPFSIETKLFPGEYYLYMKGNNAILNQTTYYVKDRVLHVFVNRDFDYPKVGAVNMIIVVPELQRINFTGTGNLKMVDTHTGHLYVRAGRSAYVEIEGQATRLDASVIDTARLNAKCFKARTIFVHTADQAQAEVINNGSVHGFATGESDIYYYDTPVVATQQLRLNGSFLRMKGIAQPTADYTLPHPPLMDTKEAVMTPVG